MSEIDVKRMIHQDLNVFYMGVKTSRTLEERLYWSKKAQDYFGRHGLSKDKTLGIINL